MALENYLKPELLDGYNKYLCSDCNDKQDALKGLKISKCPIVFTMSLSRFTFDWNIDQRVKVTERLSFPQLLNFNDYLKGYEGI
jgi:ubiquitin C-terminal hydrolase